MRNDISFQEVKKSVRRKNNPCGNRNKSKGKQSREEPIKKIRSKSIALKSLANINGNSRVKIMTLELTKQ